MIPAPEGIQNHDIVACLTADRRYAVKQRVGGDLVPLRTAPYDRAAAEAAALQLASEQQSDAWIEEAPGMFRCLNT